MYGLKYTIPFKTISDIDCIVNVELKDYIGSPVELIGGGEPFIIDKEDVDVLAPIRSSLATLSVYGSDYLNDLYTSDPQGIRIKLLVNGSVKWIGFLTPDTFNQDFSSPEFIYEMECVAALSTLKHKKFDLTADKVTFLDIIKRARDLSGYVDLYLTDSVRGKLDENIYELAGVASGNFFDELGEAMTYYEALGEIAKYLGCCFTPFEDDLYLVDYLAIKKGFNGYHKYSGNTKTSVTLSDSREVNSVGYKGTGSTISRIPGKNKIAVNCSLYEVKDFLPNIDDAVEKSVWSGYSEVGHRKNSKSPTHTLITVPLVCDDNSNVYYYYSDMTPIVSDQKPLTAEAYSALMKVVRYTSDNVPTKLSFGSELFVKNYSSRANALAGKILQETHPILNLKSEKSFFVHDKIYFALSCEIQVNIENKPESSPDALIMTDPLNKATYETDEYRIPVKLRIGDHYYNGTSWQTTSAIFYMPFPFVKDEYTFGRFIKSKNTNTYQMGLGDISGYIINPPPAPIFGDIELTFYAVYHNIMQAALHAGFGAKWTFIKNIKFEQTIQDLEGIYEFKEEKEDLIYESEISEDFIDEADDIDLKICTNTDGKISLSSVITDSGLLDGIKSLSVPFTGVAEEAIIEKALQIYDSPRYQINPTLNNVLLPYSLVTENHLPGSTFVVCGGEENVKMESCTYNLIEI